MWGEETKGKKLKVVERQVQAMNPGKKGARDVEGEISEREILERKRGGRNVGKGGEYGQNGV